jgi:Rieske Fe-S protein
MKRRSFLKWATHGLSALFAAILGIPAIAYLIDARNRAAKTSDFQTVGRLSDLKPDEPKQVVLHDVRRDAWTLHPNDVVGRVWLVRRADDRVDAFTTICPHLGCSINYEEKAHRFICPCHNGTFELSGERVSEAKLGAANPPPRDIDKLEVKLTPDPSRKLEGGKPDAIIAVKYANYYQGRPEKEVKA